MTSFIQELATKIESKRRSFEDILNGVPAPSETVAYRISKIDAARPTSDPIQDFWVFNVNNEVEIMDFIDTRQILQKIPLCGIGDQGRLWNSL